MSIGRKPVQRNTLYKRITSSELNQKNLNKPLKPIKNELVNRQIKNSNLIESKSI